MKSTVVWLSLLATFSSFLSAAETHWIWSETERQSGITASFDKKFSIAKPVTSALLRTCGESASLRIKLDDRLIASVGPYDQLLRRDISEQLRTGQHRLTVQSTSFAGPAAFFLQLDVTFADDSRRSIVTDESWLTDQRPATTFGPVSQRLLIREDRGIEIGAVDNYDQWKQALGAQQVTDPASFLVMPGFDIALIRPAKEGEDSWVSLAIDPSGRAIIAQEKKGLLRMTLTNDGRRVTQVERINDSLEECRGLLFAFGDLFANANNSRGLFRLRSDGNDQFGEPELLYGSSGGVGHGRNDLALGPDGKIYMIHGDAVDLPEKCVDYTSPFRAARRGERTREGHLLRISPDGGPVEVLAAGLRNPFGIDFNVDGEVFTYDADAEYDMGSPWYRPTRVSHLVTGGDYGWRGVTKSWPSYYPDHPDNALPNLDIGKGSPTAVKFGARSNFPSPYRDALFILDWTYGRIIAVHVIPRGSSYLLAAETFLKGRPLNVTDLDFARDGSMYFVTGGRGTKSALYRIRYVGEERSDSEIDTPQQKARRRFAQQSRELRRRLESLLRREFDGDALSEAWQQLANDDPWIRHAARNILERADILRWQDWAFAEKNPTALVTALLAVARSNNGQLRGRVLERLNQIAWPTLTEADKTTALYVYWLCLAELHDLDSRLASDVTKRLDRLYPQPQYRVNRLLSEILVALKAEGSTAKTIDLLKATNSQAEQMHYLYVLRNVKQGWTLADRRDYLTALHQSRHYIGGQGMPDFLEKIRAEAIATLSDSERESLASLIEESSDWQVVEQTPPRPFVTKWTVGALAPYLDEVGRGRNLRRGAAMFAAASCNKCHRIAGRGSLVGPDLTSVSSRFSRRDLLQSIITPSKVVADKYRSLHVITTDGKTFVGQPALGGDYRSPVLRLAIDPARPFTITEISKSIIEEERPSLVSWMPEGLLNTLTKNEILDLLAYLEAGGEVPSG